MDCAYLLRHCLPLFSLFDSNSPGPQARARSPGTGLRPPRSPRGPRSGPGGRRAQKVTGRDRGRQGRGPRHAARRRRRKLFPARKLPGSAAADRLPSAAARARGRPFPGRGPAGREGAGQARHRPVGAGGARALGCELGRIVSAASDQRRWRHKRARPGVAVPKLPPLFAAPLTAFFVCLSPPSAAPPLA